MNTPQPTKPPIQSTTHKKPINYNNHSRPTQKRRQPITVSPNNNKKIPKNTHTNTKTKTNTRTNTSTNTHTNTANIEQRIITMQASYKGNHKIDPTHNKAHRIGICRCVRYNNATTADGIDTIDMQKCTKPVKPGTDFCPEHQNCTSFLRQFVNGYEPTYNPNDWAHPYIEGSHNCYAYFLDDRKDSIKVKCEELCLKNNKKGCPKKDSECRDLIPQPGDHFLMNQYGNLKKKTRKYSCPNMHSRIIADNPQIKSSKLTEKCPNGYYKGAMVVDPGNTFHFYRQNPDSTWSHKPGVLPVTNKDASGKKIYIPHFADRDYTQNKNGNIKYDDFCGYYCIPHDNNIQTNLI